MSKIFALVFFFLVVFAGGRTTSAAPKMGDLVEVFGKRKDMTISGVKLGTVMNVRLNSTTKIADVYNKIYWGGITPNQIVCKTDWMGDENDTKLATRVMWSVWYQPGAMVALNTECVDTLQKPWVTNSWYMQGYRWLGSGYEPHKSLIWLTQWTQIQKGYPKSVPYKWCRASSFSFAARQDGDVAWGKVYQKAVFDYEQASNALALVSRDVTCTSDTITYSRWVKTPGWSFIFVKSLY